MASTDILYRECEKFNSQHIQKKKRGKVNLGPEVLVKTSRGGEEFEYDDPFGMDWDVEYSVNKNNRWELKDFIVDQIRKSKGITFSRVNVDVTERDLKKLKPVSYERRYDVRGAKGLEFVEKKDDDLVHKTSKRAQLRTWKEPMKYSRPVGCQLEERVICICGKCTVPRTTIVDYTTVTYCTPNKTNAQKHMKTKVVEVEENDETTEQHIKYVPKKRKNEVRREKHNKHFIDY